MKKLFIGTAALALVASCGQPAPTSATDIAAEALEMAEAKPNAGNPALAEAALTAMNLTQDNAFGLNFEDRSLDGATATFTNLEIEGLDGLKADRLVIEGLDLEGDTPIFGKMTLSDLELDIDAIEGKVNVDAVELVNPSAEIAAWMTSVVNGEKAEFPDPEDVKFDAWSVSDISIDSSTDAVESVASIAKIQILGMTGDEAKAATISGISALGIDADGSETFKMGLKNATLSNLQPELVRVLQQAVSGKAVEDLAESMNDMVFSGPLDRPFDAFSIEGLSVGGSGLAFDLPELSNSAVRNSKGQVTRVVTDPFTMTFTAESEAGMMGEMVQSYMSLVGFETLEMKGAGIADYEPSTDLLSFSAEDNYLDIVDGAEFRFGGKIAGYSAYSEQIKAMMTPQTAADGSELPMNPLAIMGAFDALNVETLELRLTDKSLIDRGMNAYATQIGMDPTIVKGMAVPMIGNLGPIMQQFLGMDPSIGNELSGGLSKLISNRGTLTIVLNPDAPLNIGELMTLSSPAELTKEKLGLQVSYEKPTAKD